MSKKRYKLTFIVDSGSKVKMVDVFAFAESRQDAREILIGLGSNWDAIESEELMHRANPTYRTAKNTVECHGIGLA